MFEQVSKSFTFVFALALVGIAIAESIFARETDSSLAAVPKNIIYIMLDDADFSDFGYNNHLIPEPDAQTPNIDSLRKGGRLFTNFYSGSSVCSPTRASVLTGKYPAGLGVLGAWSDKTAPPGVKDVEFSSSQRKRGLNGLPNNIFQIGLMMKSLGKATGHFGKWHVGLIRPQYSHKSLGFDHFGYFDPDTKLKHESWHGRFEFATHNTTYEKHVDYMDFEFTEMILKFIDEHADSKDGFYLNYWPFTPHVPLSHPLNFDNSKTGFDLSTKRGKLLAMMYAIDGEIGRIVQRLKQKEILDETLIVVTSDNGGKGGLRNKHPFLTGRKAMLTQGGLRVSMIAHWPEGIEANSANTSVITTSDLLPTFVELLGYENIPSLEAKIDGRSKKSAFLEDMIMPHNPIFWETSMGQRSAVVRQQAMRAGKYHLHKFKGRYHLYNLETDPAGKKDIAGDYPKLTDNLAKQMRSLRKSVSRWNEFPETAERKTIVPFDPRLDITEKDMTLSFHLVVPVETTEETVLLSRRNAYRLLLQKDGRLAWHIRGVAENREPVSAVLDTTPLKPGAHRITLSVLGKKNHHSIMRIHSGRKLIGEMDGSEKSIFSFWSSDAPLEIGNENVKLSGIRYHTVHLSPEDLE